MRCITLWQPWASLIIMGHKTIETRTHPRFACLEGQRFAIHAGAAFDFQAGHEIQEVLHHHYHYISPELRNPSCWPKSAVLGTVFCMEHRLLTAADTSRAMCDCEGVYLSRWGLILRDIERFDPPIPAKGHQGIWNWERP